MKFLKGINNSEKLYEICRFAKIKSFKNDEEIFDSQNNQKENFFIFEGEVNYFEIKEENSEKEKVKNFLFSKKL